MGRRSTTGGVTPAGDRIAIRFTWNGKDLRPTLDLKPNAANLRAARKLRQDIVDEIRAGTFVLSRYFPNYRFADKVQGAGQPERTLRDWTDVWAQASARSMEHSTLAIYKRHMAAYWLAPWGHLVPRRISHEMVLTRLSELAADRLDEATGNIVKGLSRKTQNNILIPLRGVFALACRDGGADPTDGIDNLKVQKPLPDPFTLEEVELVLAKARDVAGDEMADWFEFAFFAGLRSSEQIALPWADVDLRSATVEIRGARVMGKAKDRTKTHASRTVELNARAAAVIERQRARTQLQQHGKVFATAGNPSKPWHDEQVQWRAWVQVLRLCGVRYRPPKEARDTSVTLALTAGADLRWVAAQHGHSVQVMLTSYAKWIPRADRGRNVAAVNSALQPQSESAESQKAV